MQWIKHKKEERMAVAAKVIGAVRLGLVDMKVVIEELNTEEMQRDTESVFHLPKNSGNSGRVVNGTRLFGSFHWKFSGINRIPEKVVPFSRWKLPNGKFVFHLQIPCLTTSSMPFAVS